MGRHSNESKRRKRCLQKKKRRCQKKQTSLPQDVFSSSSETDDASASKETGDAGNSSDDSFFKALDRIADEQAAYWRNMEPDIDELNRSRDVHPTIVTDEDRFIEVYVGNNHQDTSGLLRVSTEEHFARLHRREAQAVSLCKNLRNRIETLEENLLDAQRKLVNLQTDKQNEITRVRKFWRDRVLEEGSRAGTMLLASLKQYNCYRRHL